MDKATVTRIRLILLLTLVGLFVIGVAAGPYGVPDYAYVKLYRPAGWPGAADCYFRVIVDDDKTIPLPSFGDFPGWCVDLYHTINLNTWYYADLTVKLTTEDYWGRINWILNNKHENWKVKQGAIWRVIYPSLPWDGPGGIEDRGNLSLNDSEESAADALASASASHSGFTPGPGQIVAVLVDAQEPKGCREYQKLIFEYRIPSGGDGVPEFGEGVPAIASLSLVSYLLLKRRLKAN